MKDLVLTNNQLNSEGYWSNAIGKLVFSPTAEDLALFDQNGYDLTELEKEFASANEATPKPHRSHRTALKQDWFTQEPKDTGALLNHSLMFERKGYKGAALVQLKYWAVDVPRVHQIKGSMAQDYFFALLFMSQCQLRHFKHIKDFVRLHERAPSILRQCDPIYGAI